ncbi:MAG TPA: TonB-dependent receptor [Steroidobacteraceae bacterium]|jgi:iron complex outermembrane receptor protein|nr:TonB-dependent receptor [Steroidobacteraceae bacterium]
MSYKINRGGIRSHKGPAPLIKAGSLSGASALTLAVLANLYGAPVRAADAAVEETGLTEIVVTAEKRSENLEVVPASISAFTSKTLDLQGIASVQDLTNYAPGLYYTTYDNRPYIRGIGRNTDNLAVESGVAVYVDGIYNGANASTILQSSSLFIDEIQVLRGPQNTLFGRNADGGMIDYISKRPTSDFQGEVRTGYDNYHKAFVEGAVSGPINDAVRYRFGGNYTNQNGKGFYTNLNGVDEGGDVAQGGNGTSYHIEGQLEGNVGSNFDWWAKLATSDYDVSYHTETLLGPLDTREFPVPLFPNANFGTCAMPGGAGGLGCAGSPDTIVSVLTGKNTIAGNPSATGTGTFDSGFQSQSKQQNNWIFATHLTFHADGFDVKYLGGWQKFNYDLTAPWTNSQGVSSGILGYTLQGPAAPTPTCGFFFGATNLAGCSQNLVINSAHNNFTFDEYEQFFSNELNIASTGQGPLQWLGGLYQFHEKYTQPINVNSPDQAQLATPYSIVAIAGGALVPAPANPSRSAYNEYTALAEDSYGVFGQIDWQASSQFKFTTGLRYSYDKKSGDQTFRIMAFNFEGVGLGVNTFGANTPAFDITPAATTCNGQSYRGTGACGFNANGAAATTLNDHWDAVTGTAGVAWTPATDILGYAKYSRGYKAGGFNSGTNAPDPETAKETVDAFEVGYKETFGKTFQANLATFYYDYKNDQQPLGVLDPTTAVVNTIIVNIPKVHTYGAELETLWNPITDLNILLNYAYLHSTISSTNGVCYQDAADPLAIGPGANTGGCPAGSGLQNIVGAKLPASPLNKIALNAIYTLHFTPGSLALSGTYIWRDRTYDDVFNRSYTLDPSYAQVNLRAIWTDAANRYNVIVYANNLTNKIAQDASFGLGVNNPGPGQVIDPVVSYIPPRVYGVELRYRFH